jgi:hypothetical protein
LRLILPSDGSVTKSSRQATCIDMATAMNLGGS